MSKKQIIKSLILGFLFLSFPVGILSAQEQVNPLSGNDPSSYECFDRLGNLITQNNDRTDVLIRKDERRGIFYCDLNKNGIYDECTSGIYDSGSNCEPRAQLKPPTLQQLEIWFVRIVYAVWAVVGMFSFLGIVVIGYQYMISRGAPEAMVKVRDRIGKFILGFCLVFLAVPILNTVFRLLQVNDSVQCYQGLTSNVGIGFQFFFPELCTDPNNEVVVSDPCTYDGNADGLTCNDEGAISNSCFVGSRCLYFQCSNGIWVSRNSSSCVTR